LFTINDILDLGTQIEKNGEKLLREAQIRCSDPNLVSLLQWLADEEVQHAHWLSDLRPTSGEDNVESELEAMGRSLLRDILGEKGFSLDDLDFTNIEHANEMLLKMIEFEKDVVLFYEMIRSVVSDKKTLDCIDRIIDQEKKHAQKLRQFMESNVTKPV
jgi:rubrerythrin